MLDRLLGGGKTHSVRGWIAPLAVAVAVTGLAMRSWNAGGELLAFILGPLWILLSPWLVVAVVHIVVHNRSARGHLPPRQLIAAALLSDAAFMSALLLQWEVTTESGPLSSVGETLTLASVLSVAFQPGPEARLLGDYQVSPPSWLSRDASNGLVWLLALALSWALLLTPPLASWRRAATIAFALIAVLPTLVVLAASVSVAAESLAQESASVRAAGGRVPTRCGSQNEPVPISAPPYHDFGRSPVFFAHGVGPTNLLTLERRDRDLALHGLGSAAGAGVGDVHIAFTVVSDTPGPVNVRIVDESSSASLDLRDDPRHDGPNDGGFLNPAHQFIAASLDTQPREFEHYLRLVAFPHAGCYRIEAMWLSGSWSIPLAVGE